MMSKVSDEAVAAEDNRRNSELKRAVELYLADLQRYP